MTKDKNIMTKIRKKKLYFVDANIKIIEETKANQIQQNINKCLFYIMNKRDLKKQVWFNIWKENQSKYHMLIK